jgi:hypothetical protein
MVTADPMGLNGTTQSVTVLTCVLCLFVDLTRARSFNGSANVNGSRASVEFSNTCFAALHPNASVVGNTVVVTCASRAVPADASISVFALFSDMCC